MPQSAGLNYYHYPRQDSYISPVVLIHGAGSNALGWPSAFRRSLERSVIALDLPGHGLSKGAGCSSLDGYARAVSRFMDKYPLHRAVLIGHSMGAGVALHTAAWKPTEISALILLAAGFPFTLPEELLKPLDAFDGLRLSLKYFETAAFSSAAPISLRRAITNPLHKVPVSLLKHDLLACEGLGRGIDWRRITCPCLVVAGSNDNLISPAYARVLTHMLPDARFKQIDQGGHIFLHEQPEASLKVIREFLDWLDKEKAL